MGGALRADNRLFDDFLAAPAGVIRMELFASAFLVETDERVRLGTKRVLLDSAL